MKNIVYSILFLVIEVGAFLFFGMHHALSGGFTVVLLILIAKNIFVLYNSLKPKKMVDEVIHPRAVGIAADGIHMRNQEAFSSESLERIEQALSETTVTNPFFDYSVSADILSARYCFGEGMDVYLIGTRYRCDYFRERSYDIKYEDSEESAVSSFISGCKVGMTMKTE